MPMQIPPNSNVLFNDTDPDGDKLTVTEVNGLAVAVGTEITLDSGALLTINADGTYDYDPNAAFDHLSGNEQATDSFIYTVSDGRGGTDTASVNITIDGVTDGEGLTAGPPPENHDRGVPGSTNRDAMDLVTLEDVLFGGGGGVDSVAPPVVLANSSLPLDDPLAGGTIAALV
jgi:VCBS repeat-containing protein